MAEPQRALATFPATNDYEIAELAKVMTPALAIYADKVAANIATTIRVLGGDANRWRPHVKTSKLGFVMRQLAEQGVVNVKCATTLELQTAAEAGATDILVAYPMMGANAQRVRELAEQLSDRRISALVENAAQIQAWAGSRVGLFIDVNSGLDRTGLEQDHLEELIKLAQAIEAAGLVFRGLHVYDGHMSKYADLATREVMAHQNYDHLLELVTALNAAGLIVEEVITAGTPAFPCAITYPTVQRSTVRSPRFTGHGCLRRLHQHRATARRMGLRTGGSRRQHSCQPANGRTHYLRRGPQSGFSGRGRADVFCVGAS